MIPRSLIACTLVGVLMLTGWHSPVQAEDKPTPENLKFFEDRIRPVFVEHCYACHNSAGTQEGGLALDHRKALQKGGESGPAIVPGEPEKSLLLKVLRHEVKGQEMPQGEAKLDAAILKDFERWIKLGAADPRDQPPSAEDLARLGSWDSLLEKRKNWWSFQPVRFTEPPEVSEERFSHNPIDRFIHHELERRKLRPSPKGDPAALLRRASFDLTGLPPTPKETRLFAEDQTPGAWERAVDRLLASPHYGEQWGRHWLDVVRFGESNGFERNIVIDNLWPFRDYVIRSFNEDKPFDQFVREHLAGDVIGQRRPEVEIGTAFLVCGPYDNVGNQDAKQAAQIRANTIDEMIRATSETFLGLTVGCARCHDHKFDPIGQRDYYAMYATFAGVQHGDRPVATPKERRELAQKQKALKARLSEVENQIAAIERSSPERTKAQAEELLQLSRELQEIPAQIAKAPDWPKWWIGRFSQPGETFHVFQGGDPQRPGEPITAKSLEALDGLSAAYKLPENAPEGQRRLALANWIGSPQNPLAARVIVNRVWHYHFGTGLVETPSDFGVMGGKPSHPELLDFLAIKLMQPQDQGGFGWRLKPLHRLILLSETYQQSSKYRAEEANQDAGSRTLWRFPPRRLSAEEIRDSMLHIAGKLDPKAGGPGFRLYQYLQDNVATYVPLDVHPPETYRRAVYHQNARAALVDILSDFDAPDPAFAAPNRSATVTPLQALSMMNHSFPLDIADAWAKRLEAEAGSDLDHQIRLAYEQAYSRWPDDEELTKCRKAVEEQGLRVLCRAIFNSNEFLYLR